MLLPIHGEVARSAGGAAPLVMLGAFGSDGLFSRPVERVAAQHPPAEAHHTESSDEERDAHPEPGGDPFTGKKNHGSNYHGATAFGRSGRLGCYLEEPY